MRDLEFTWNPAIEWDVEGKGYMLPGEEIEVGFSSTRKNRYVNLFAKKKARFDGLCVTDLRLIQIQYLGKQT